MHNGRASGERFTEETPQRPAALAFVTVSHPDESECVR